MHSEDYLPENLAAKAQEFGLSRQQRLIARFIVSERLTVQETAKRLGTSVANVYGQIKKIKQKAESASKKQALAALASQARQKYRDLAGSVLYLHSRGAKNRDIAEALGIDKRTVADILYRNKGKRYVLAEIPACENKESPTVTQDHRNAFRLYYRSFVEGNTSPNSSTGRDVLRGLALAGVGGWTAKKIVLSDRANMLQVLAERGRADSSLLHVDKEVMDGDTRAALASVLDRHFRRVGPSSWKSVTPSAWTAVREAAELIAAEGRT